MTEQGETSVDPVADATASTDAPAAATPPGVGDVVGISDLISLLTRSGQLAWSADPETGDLVQFNEPTRGFLVERPGEAPHISDLLAVPSLRYLVDDILPQIQRGQVWDGELEGTDDRWLQTSLSGIRHHDSDRELDLLVGICRDTTKQHRAFADLSFRANHDLLTGLPNRAPLEEMLSALLATRLPFAVVYLDIDHFKRINDNYGHETGNGLLQAVAERLQRAVRNGDLVARVGGDEFIVVLDGIETIERAMPVAARLLDLVSAPGLMADGVGIELTASAGLALPVGHRHPAEVIRDADAAMYTAKSRGRNGSISVYDEETRDADNRRKMLASSLDEAVTQRRIRVSYLPVVDLVRRTVIGVEALARWPQPDGSPVSPAEFIPLAEEMGIIADLDDVVMETAMTAVKPLTANNKPLKLHVNISAQRLDQYLPERMQWLLEHYEFDPRRLVLEVTEGSMAVDPEAAEDITARLSAMGVEVALDDFGTGYSSLSHLTRFGLDALKIDRAFVEGLDDPVASTRGVVTAILTLAESLGVDVVAEGIETEAQAKALVEAGCRYGQGFLISRPIRIEQLTDLLEATRPQLEAGSPQPPVDPATAPIAP